MPLRNRSQVYDPTGAGSAIDLPPFGRAEDKAIMLDTVSEIIPNAADDAANIVIPRNKLVGYRIQYRCTVVKDTQAEALLWRQTVREWLWPDGVGRTFQLALWSDTDQVIKEFYRGVQCVGFTAQPAANSSRELAVTFDFLVTYPKQFDSYSDSSQPSATEYETYVYSDGTIQSAVPPTGSVTINSTSPQRQFFGIFPVRLDETTGATNDGWLQIHWKIPVAGTVKNFQCTGARPATIGAASSTLRLSDTDYQSAGNGIDLTLAAADKFENPGAGTFSVSQGDDVYCYVTAAGNHQWVQVQFELEDD